MHTRTSIAPLWLALIALLSFAGTRSVEAANANKPRVPVVWTDAPCMQIVDRSTAPFVHLEYMVPSEENGERTSDEVGDSRTHQFFAFAAQKFEAAPPRWVSQADIDRASRVDPMVIPSAIDPEDVLATTSRWHEDEWVRITADDARVPITLDQAAMGVQWDVATVRPGTWLVKGYTWEPVINLWAVRWAAVKVIASAVEADGAGPSVLLLPEEVQIETGVEHPVPGCIDAPVGSTLTLEYGVVEGTIEPQWQVVEQDMDVATGVLDLPFVPPAQLAGMLVRLRATITDPTGSSYVAYGPNALPVVQGPETDAGGCRYATDDPPPFVAALGLILIVVRRRKGGGAHS